jgi:organic hydroperoxide reductase OsmC/OhrA
MKFKPRLYPYRTTLAWSEGKKGRLSSAGKPVVEVACPPEFGGPPGFWSPEDLLVASVEVCIMTTFLHLLARRKVPLASYVSRAEGVAGLEDGEFRFVRIDLHVDVHVARPQDERVAAACLETAADQCMVSRSLRCPVKLEHVVTAVADASPTG